MDEENNENSESSVNTAGDEQAKKQQKGNSSVGQKVNKAKDKVESLKKYRKVFSILLKGLIPILIFIIIVGTISYLMNMPGLVFENIVETAKNAWGTVVATFTGNNVTVDISEDDQKELAQRLQDMGYDVVGYGFADATYENEDKEGAEEAEGYSANGTGTVAKIYSGVDDHNYLLAYIAKSESTYYVANWSIEGFFKGLFNGKNSTDYSQGMIKLTGKLEGINSEINREDKLLRLRNQGSSHAYYYDLSNWTAVYGTPLELFLALHLGTMMPDLTYDLATADVFNTKVNIAFQDVTSTYEIKINTGTETITQDDILKILLAKVCNLSDEKITEFEREDKLYEAFEAIQTQIKTRHAYTDEDLGFQDRNALWWEGVFNLNDGDEVDSSEITSYTYKGYDLSKVEITVFGEARSETRTIAIISTEPFMGVEVNPDPDSEPSKITIGPVIGGYDLKDNSDADAIINALAGTELEGYSIEQIRELLELMEEGTQEETISIPRIESVTNHWFYDTITFTYGTANAATRKVQYIASEDSTLTDIDIVLQQTYTSSEGIYYQLCEPEMDGPNEAIVALFTGGTGSINRVDYDFPGEYYRYDGTRATAQKIANAKAADQNEGTYWFQGEEYSTVDSDENEDWAIEKEAVTFATVDEDGNYSYTDAYAAFAILENVHTTEAQYVYRMLKELLVDLQYFSAEDFEKPLTQVLLWPIKEVGTTSVDIEDEGTAEGLYKDEDQYGLFLENGVAFETGNTIIAPGDAEVVAVTEDSITLKYKSLSSDTIAAIKARFGDDYAEPDADIVLDMTMTICGITPSVEAGATVQMGDTIGVAGSEDIQILFYNIDKSIVDDIETYMYPTYVGEYSYYSYEAITIEQINENMKTMYNRLIEAGCTQEGALGIMGNIMQESTFNPSAINESNHRGIVQWSTSRWSTLTNWCSQNGYDPWSFEGQLEFMIYEMQTSTYKSSVWDVVTTSKDLATCVESIMYDYEVVVTRSSSAERRESEFSKRYGYAQGFQEKLDELTN